MNSTGIIILAAGNSSRLGMPKQILLYQGRSLIAFISDEAMKAKLEPIVIVTGANASKVTAAVQNRKVAITHNKNWEQGMGSGVARGIAKLLLMAPDIQNVIISVCDQPFLNDRLFLGLCAAKVSSGKDIVACSYGGSIGVPALFSKKYFHVLKQLKGQEGARELLKAHAESLATVSFPLGIIDIDTVDDYRQFLRISETLQRDFSL